MRYHGGKYLIANDLATTIHNVVSIFKEETGFTPTGYTEPFCGIANVYKHISVLFQDYNLKYHLNDANNDIILLLKALKNGWKPPMNITKAERAKLKNARPSALRTYAGFQYSFGGRFFGAYIYNRKNDGRDYIKIGAKMKRDNVTLTSEDYKKLSHLEKNIIYCDPPYAGTFGYKFDFDSNEFWNWVRKMSKNNLVFVSEYNAPDDFVKLYERDTKQRMATNTEKLYIYECSLKSK